VYARGLAIALHCGGIDSAGGRTTPRGLPPIPIYKPQYTPPSSHCQPSVRPLSPSLSHPREIYPQFVSNNLAIFLSLFFLPPSSFPSPVRPFPLRPTTTSLVVSCFLVSGGGRADFSRHPRFTEFLIYFSPTGGIFLTRRSAYYAIRIFRERREHLCGDLLNVLYMCLSGERRFAINARDSRCR